MLKAKDIHPGTIVEIVSLEPLMRLHEDAGSCAFTGIVTPMVVGEQYEFTDTIRRHSRDVPSMVARVRQVGGTKAGEVFWFFLNKHVRLVSQPALPAPVNDSLDTDFSLNANEEFVFVSKAHPTQVFRILSGYPFAPHAKDVQDGELVFNTQSGQRKRFKNKAVLTGFLNNISGFYSANRWYEFFKANPAIAAEQQFHLHGLESLPEWVAGGGLSDFQEAGKLELRKYNTDTRTISGVAVDFDAEGYLNSFAKKFQMTRLFGEGASAVVSGLEQNGTLDQYGFLFSAKFGPDKWTTPVAKEKDIQLDLACKALGLKKKDLPHYNANGFVAVAFKTRADLDAFASHFSNPEKTMVQLDIHGDILSHPEVVHPGFPDCEVPNLAPATSRGPGL
jgi:hypothetical protein